MNEDTSSSPRQEWYEADYEPDEPKLQPPSIPLVTLLERLTAPKVGEIVTDKSGHPMGVVLSIDPANQTAEVAVSGTFVTTGRRVGKSTHTHMVAITDAYKDAIQKFIGMMPKQSDFVQTAPESVRDRALRLAKQPHSMAQDPHDFHFDHRGRRRY